MVKKIDLHRETFTKDGKGAQKFLKLNSEQSLDVDFTQDLRKTIFNHT